MIPGVSISHQTALLNFFFLRFLAHPASTLTIHPRYKLYDHRTTTHSYNTVYQVHNNSNTNVIFWTTTSIHVVYFRTAAYWTTTSTHVVPDRQQYDRHTPSSSRKRRYDTCCKYVILNPLKRIFDDFQTTLHPH